MSYLALARKWRPRSFAEVSGQQHVVEALVNALDSGRVHHAFLLTGTRGVGKTTLGRIFAKALNCEKGISSTPCGTCGHCQSVDRGNFVDLIEVDAASRTRVDDTRELLDNVQYVPTIGRFKIYLIDEVHMLSGHSFNALLKTLEEPPEHVKFLLATTDPQKLPVTVLSRCLQFHLRTLDREQIATRLEEILKAEEVAFDAGAVDILSRSANGSVRDALSLLDQAIAYGGGEVREDRVRTMLGMIDQTHIESLLEALAARDVEGAMEVVAQISGKSPDYAVALDDLLLGLHRIALARLAPRAAQQLDGVPTAVTDLVKRFSDEDLQWYYQAGLLGKRDLPLAPEPRTGFEMMLLRMLAFHLTENAAAPAPQKSASRARQSAAVSPPAEPAEPAASPAAESPPEENGTNTNGEFSLESLNAETWPQWIKQAPFQSVVRELAIHSIPLRVESNCLTMTLDGKGSYLKTDSVVTSLAAGLGKMTGATVKVRYEEIAATESPGETPADRARRMESDARDQTIRKVHEDPNVQKLQTELNATLLSESIEAGGE